MGTRADFYKNTDGVDGWLGSTAWDGYPEGIVPHVEETEVSFGGREINKTGEWPEGEGLLDAKTESEFIERVERFFQYRDDVSLPADGWPWPWEDSGTTDYAYVWTEHGVRVYSFGSPPQTYEDEEPNPHGHDDVRSFPDMSEVQKVTFGGRSGVIILGTG